MLGDTAVAVNPEDPRYKHLIGKIAILPLVGRKLKIIGDPIVSMEFGTGALKVTPSHDVTDFELSQRHQLDHMTIMDSNAYINKFGGQFQGMERYEARKAVVAQLQEQGFLVKIEPYDLSLGKCYRCKDVIEPLISPQWFVKVAPLAQTAIEAVESGRTKIIPEHWTKTYFEWMRNIRDWCISRQIWWGHRIPAWTCEDCGEIIVARSTPASCPKCSSDRLVQETDVLDTWFSSALWPFSTMGWPDDTPLLKTFYPTSSLVTGFDILFFWVARMMMMGLKFMNDVPFRDVYIHALVRDEEGKKMSKSLGNVIDPLMVMDKYGTDAFRFTLAALAAQGRDIKLSESRIEGYRNFMNKIWNSARFALPYIEKLPKDCKLDESKLTVSDKWILSRLNHSIRDVGSAIQNYLFNDAAQILYHFTWHEFCDWYIEEAKIYLTGEDDEQSRNTAMVLRLVLDQTMKLLHPFIPFITEEISSKITASSNSIVCGPFPVCDETRIDDSVEEQKLLVMDVVTAIRNIRAEMNLSPGRQLPVIIQPNSSEESEILRQNSGIISSLGRVDRLDIHGPGTATDQPKMSAVAVIGELKLYVPLEGVIDPETEIARLTKELAKLDKDLDSVTKKLGNEAFLSKANPEAIQKQKDRHFELSSKRAGLTESLEKMLKFRTS